MTDKQKNLKGRMDSEDGCSVVMTQAEFDRTYGKKGGTASRSKTGPVKKTTTAKKK